MIGKLVNGHAMVDICQATQNPNGLIQAAAIAAAKEMMEKAGDEATDLYAYMAKRWHHLGNIWIKEALVCLTRFLYKALSVYLTQLDPIDHIGPGIKHLFQVCEKYFCLKKWYAKGNWDTFQD